MAKKTDETQKQIEEATNNWKRVLADYQNLKKRVENEREAIVKFANTILLLKLLPILDNLEKAAAHISQGQNQIDDGLQIIIKQFKDVLREEGVEEIETQGKEFDPEEMEAVEMVGGQDDNKVVEVILSGFKLNGKIIRPARVKVSKKEAIEENKS